MGNYILSTTVGGVECALFVVLKVLACEWESTHSQCIIMRHIWCRLTEVAHGDTSEPLRSHLGVASELLTRLGVTTEQPQCHVGAAHSSRSHHRVIKEPHGAEESYLHHLLHNRVHTI